MAPGKNLQKSLQDYLAKIKKPNPNIQINLSSSTNWILSGCKHPRTRSFAAADRNKDNKDDDAATLSDVDRFLFENFRSLYNDDEDINTTYTTTESRSEKHKEDPNGLFLFDSPRFLDLPPDLYGSRRFFVSSGGSSSLVEEARTSLTMSEALGLSSTTATTTTTTPNESSLLSASARATINNADEVTEMMVDHLPDETIAVLTYSPNPYDDFRRSMQDMIESRLEQGQKIDWDFMEELLFCYLKLNEKKSYKYILSAFVDIVVILRENSSQPPPTTSRRTRTEGHKREKKKCEDSEDMVTHVSVENISSCPKVSQSKFSTASMCSIEIQSAAFPPAELVQQKLVLIQHATVWYGAQPYSYFSR
ncbi:Ovate protein family, C-terminal [Dillenia turbinata]|uniref:Transcription repressor n=1 Tax=Dillenia turbinata TaxID=194707 RepID=A0AAN8YTG9_9MAGN